MSADIRLGKYRVTSYESGWTVAEVKARGAESKAPGEEYEVASSYHARVSDALANVLERRLRDSDATSVADLMREVAAFRAEIADAFAPEAVA